MSSTVDPYQGNSSQPNAGNAKGATIDTSQVDVKIESDADLAKAYFGINKYNTLESFLQKCVKDSIVEKGTGDITQLIDVYTMAKKVFVEKISRSKFDFSVGFNWFKKKVDEEFYYKFRIDADRFKQVWKTFNCGQYLLPILADPGCMEKNQTDAKKYFGVEDVSAFLEECENLGIASDKIKIFEIYKMAKDVFINQSNFANSGLFFNAVSAKFRSTFGGTHAEFRKILRNDCLYYSLSILANKTVQTKFVDCINKYYEADFAADNNLYQNLLKYRQKIQMFNRLLGYNYLSIIRTLAKNGYFEKQSDQTLLNDFETNQSVIKDKLISVFNLQKVLGLQFLRFNENFYELQRNVLTLGGRAYTYHTKEENQYSTFEPFIGLEKNDITVLGKFAEPIKHTVPHGPFASGVHVFYEFEDFLKDLKTKKETLITIFEKQKEFGICNDEQPEKELLKQVKKRMITCCEKQDEKLRSIENLNEKIARIKEDIVKKIIGEDEVKQIQKSNKNKDRFVNLYDTEINALSKLLNKINENNNNTLTVFPTGQLLKIKKFIDNNEHFKYLEKLDSSYENHTDVIKINFFKSKGIIKSLEQILQQTIVPGALNKEENVDEPEPQSIEQPGGSFLRKTLRNKNVHTKKNKGIRLCSRRTKRRRKRNTIRN
jgi:hypothetical protein